MNKLPPCSTGASKRRKGSSTPRRLLAELLEQRELLSVAGWQGEGEACGPVAPGTGDPPADTSPTPTDSNSAPAFGPAALNSNPTVVQVDVPSTYVRSLSVTFSDDLNAAALISDGSMVSAVSLVNLAQGPVSLQANQFAYDATTRTLTLTLSQPLATGNHELRIDGSKFQNPAGKFLRGGRDGLSFDIPTFGGAGHAADGWGRFEGGGLLGPVAGGLEWRRLARLDCRREDGGERRQDASLSQLGDQCSTGLRGLRVRPDKRRQRPERAGGGLPGRVSQSL